MASEWPLNYYYCFFVFTIDCDDFHYVAANSNAKLKEYKFLKTIL